ncbi:DNA adenine methylase [Janthinobacterium sp. PC23-8]|uniref:DNA adenine methylase n=1 Tax=Janthinobacterium sp. PC23-8 TaxID=2012679 RepID=UPI000B961946|nr:DNA adenine methylase [Janthinobacterium sp. PC23-8]OYO27915.1 DNA methyltransferase [Janthinobacterium sp. PC23-8]
MTTVINPALRYHGAKFRLAPWILSFFPEHTCYVEPFGGAAGVLLQKPRVYAEVYNDLDSGVVNFFAVLRDPVLRQQLIEALVCTPYARAEFEQAWLPTTDQVELARRLCIRAQMGFGSAGATKGHTGFRIDTKREYGTAQHLWATYPASIAAAGQRMSGVLIENRPALEVMRKHDTPSTLHFVDPPYMHETRVMTGSQRTYNHELTNLDHVELLDGLLELEGFVVLSGYDSLLYRGRLDGWIRHTTTARISAARGTAIREEMVWLNPRCAAALSHEAVQGRMFA